MPKQSKAMKLNACKPHSSCTPPSSPVLEGIDPTVTLTVKELVHAVKEAIIEHGVTTSTVAANHVEIQSDGHVESKTLNRASKLEYKTVNEMYVISGVLV